MTMLNTQRQLLTRMEMVEKQVENTRLEKEIAEQLSDATSVFDDCDSFMPYSATSDTHHFSKRDTPHSASSSSRLRNHHSTNSNVFDSPLASPSYRHSDIHDLNSAFSSNNLHNRPYSASDNYYPPVSNNRPCLVPISRNIQSPSVAPKCAKVLRRGGRILDSSTIQKHKLSSPDDVAAANTKYAKPSKAPTFTVKLAKEAFFGDDVLAQCTVYGCRDYPGLPLT